MTSTEATLAAIDTLAALGVPYMVVGSLSSNYYGIARSTKDADFVVQLRDIPITAVADHLGPAFRLDPQMSFEGVTGTLRYRLHTIDTPFQIELFLLGEDEHDQERFARRCPVKLLGREAYIPTAEDVIITKLRWVRYAKRARDADDVRNVLAVQGGSLDWDYLVRWCDRHGTRELFEEIRRSVPAVGGEI